MSRRMYRPPTRRRWREQVQLDPMPPCRTIERLRKQEAHLEETLHIGGGLDLQAPERSPQPRASHFIAREAPCHIEYVLPHRIVPSRAGNARLLEDTALQEQLTGRSVTAVG